MKMCNGWPTFHPDIIIDVIECPLCRALKVIDEKNLELMELRKQIIELERK